MNIKSENKGGITVCYVSGEIDINTAPQMKKDLDRLISEKKNKILMNFKDVGYIDSSGLATLVEILKTLRKCEGKLKLSNLSAKVRSLFEITKLDRLFDISQEEKEALESLA